MVEEKQDNIWKKLIQFQLRYKFPILAAVVLITAFFIYQIAFRVTITTDFFELYPPKHPYIQLYKEYRSMFGTANVMSMVLEVKDGDIYNPKTIKKIDHITKQILSVKGVDPLQVMSLTHPRLKNFGVGSNAISIGSIVKVLPESPEDLRAIKEKIYSNEGIRGVYVTMDDKATLINAGFWEEGLDLKNLYNEMQRIKSESEDANHKLYITGYPMLYAWIASFTPKLYLIFIFTGLILMTMLIYYFRTIIGVVIPIISGLLSAIWGLGFAGVMGYNIDPLILVIPMLLSARAISHSVQCLERYHEDYLLYGDKETAIIKSYAYLYKPAIVSIVTDGLGVLTIVVCTIPLMQKLGIIGSFWIISIYISVVLLNPILVTFFPSPKTNVKSQQPVLENGNNSDGVRQAGGSRSGDAAYLVACKFCTSFSVSWKKWASVIFMLVVIVVGGIIATIHIKVGDTSAGKAILYDDHPYNVAAKKVNTQFIGANQMVVVAEGKKKGAIASAKAMKTLEDMGVYAVSNVPTAGGALTIADMTKMVFKVFHDGYPKWLLLPEDPNHIEQVFRLVGGSSTGGEMDKYISRDYTNATVIIFFRDYNNKSIKNTISILNKYITEHPVEQVNFRLAGGILGILAAVNEEVEYSYWVSMIAIFLLTFILCSLTYRSFTAALILILPLACSQVLCDWFMLAMNIDLNISSLPVAAVGVGVGVDYGLYILSRLAEEYRWQGDYEAALFTAINTTGKAVIFTATSLIGGIVLWIFSDMKFQSEMGMLLCFLMFFNMLGALIFIPAMVAVIGPERTIKKYKVD
ncbi:MAG: MMPL family transporter [Proteobacteria bacterium]|nr:MMPL family transporter [Pseudomonadota bacterium]